MQTETIWNDIYAKGPQTSSGQPGLALSQFVTPLRPGRALELGCARGDDAVWLARQGWHMTAVDVSSVALGIAARNAEAAGVADRIRFEAHDLALSFPEGSFDLVTASFLHSPQDWPRGAVLARAAQAVAPGGHILIVEHAARASWSWSPENTRFPKHEPPDQGGLLQCPIGACKESNRISGRTWGPAKLGNIPANFADDRYPRAAPRPLAAYANSSIGSQSPKFSISRTRKWRSLSLATCRRGRMG